MNDKGQPSKLKPDLREKIIVATVIALHIALAMWAANIYDLSRDEARYWWVSGQTIDSMIGWAASDNYPPLFFLFMAGLRPILGDSELGLRLPSVLLSGVCIFTFWLILLRMRSLKKVDRLLILALLAISPMQIFIASLAKYYTMLMFFALLFYYLAMRLIDDEETPSRLKWVLLIVTLLMIYTHYLGFVVIASMLAMILVTRGWGSLWGVVKGMRARWLLMICYVPWLLIFLTRTYQTIGEKGDVGETGTGLKQHLAGFTAAGYGLFWGNSVEPWHYILVGLSALLIVASLIIFIFKFKNRISENDDRLPLIQIGLFLIFGFLLTFVVISIFLKIPILFYAERFSFLVPFMTAFLILVWPAGWRKIIAGTLAGLFVFAQFNFYTKCECLNWSYSIPWKEIQASLKVKDDPSKNSIILFDNKSFGALREYYVGHSCPLWDWEFDETNTYQVRLLSDNYIKMQIPDDWRSGGTRYVGLVNPYEYVSIILYTRDVYPPGDLDKIKHWLNAYYDQVDETGLVEDTPRLHALKGKIGLTNGKVNHYKIIIAKYRLKEKYRIMVTEQKERERAEKDRPVEFVF